jgi:hypothetical protein
MDLHQSLGHAKREEQRVFEERGDLIRAVWLGERPSCCALNGYTKLVARPAARGMSLDALAPNALAVVRTSFALWTLNRANSRSREPPIQKVGNAPGRERSP